jgi:ubiquinone/menaquinone biosynthesis C-methylase UbiE
MNNQKTKRREGINFSSDLLDFFSGRRASTHAAFFTSYLRSGMTVLDCGRGPGSITLGLAEAAAPGRVVGLDIEPKNIQRAKEFRAREKIENVHFEIGDIHSLPFEEETFDAAFTHGVIEYFKDPVHTFKQIFRVLKKGGFIGARHADWGGFLLSCRNKLVSELFSLFVRLMERQGLEPNFGRNQASYLRQAGFSRIEVSASYDCWTSTPENALRVSSFMAGYCESDEFAQSMTKYRLTDRQNLRGIADAIRDWGRDPGAFAAEAWVEAVAWKEQQA